MPRFFFDIRADQHVARDGEGDELPGWQEARECAVEILPDIARGDRVDDDRREFAVQVRDETGRIGCKATLSLVVEWFGDRPAA